MVHARHVHVQDTLTAGSRLSGPVSGPESSYRPGESTWLHELLGFGARHPAYTVALIIMIRDSFVVTGEGCVFVRIDLITAEHGFAAERPASTVAPQRWHPVHLTCRLLASLITLMVASLTDGMLTNPVCCSTRCSVTGGVCLDVVGCVSMMQPECLRS